MSRAPFEFLERASKSARGFAHAAHPLPAASAAPLQPPALIQAFGETGLVQQRGALGLSQRWFYQEAQVRRASLKRQEQGYLSSGPSGCRRHWRATSLPSFLHLANCVQRQFFSVSSGSTLEMEHRNQVRPIQGL